MGRAQPTSSKPAQRTAKNTSAPKESKDSSRTKPLHKSSTRATTRPPSKAELAVAAAESELHLLKRMSLLAPSLTDLITASTSHARASMAGSLSAAVEQAEVAWKGILSVKTTNLNAEMRATVTACKSEVKALRLHLLDLSGRTSGLKDGIEHCPAPAPLLSHKQEIELTRAMAIFRREFWAKLSEIPQFQSERVAELRRVMAEGLNPNLNVFSNKSQEEPAAAVLKRIKQALQLIDQVRGEKDFYELPEKKRIQIALALLEVPATPHDCLRFMSEAAKRSATLALLESKVLCRHKSVEEAKLADDPDAAACLLLQRSLGGRALKVHETISRLTSLQTPYLAVKDYLVLCNTGLVYATINRSQRLMKNRDDLVQEGVMGLMKGIEKYDPDSGCKLGTYATFWVRQVTDRSHHFMGRVVSLPAYRISAVVKIHKAMLEEAGKPDLRQLAQRTGLTAEEVISLYPLTTSTRSMDAPADDVNHSTLGSLVPDPSSPDIEHEAGLDELKDLVQQALRHLPERLRSIVTMRFGLDGNPPLTLVEVGQRLSLTRERIRQLQAKAFLSLYKLSRREERFAALSRYLPSAS